MVTYLNVYIHTPHPQNKNRRMKVNENRNKKKSIKGLPKNYLFFNQIFKRCSCTFEFFNIILRFSMNKYLHNRSYVATHVQELIKHSLLIKYNDFYEKKFP